MHTIEGYVFEITRDIYIYIYIIVSVYAHQ